MRTNEKKKEKQEQKSSLGKKWQKKRLQSIKVALVYDRVNKWGGAERVLLALHTIFPDAPLFTSVHNPQKASWAKVFSIQTSFLQKIPFAINHHQLFAPLMPFAFRQFSFDDYDLVISVTSEFAKGIRVKGKTKHICICLTPTRYLWSGYKEYFTNTFYRLLFYPLVWGLRKLDKKVSQYPHEYIAISKEVQRRIKKYYGRTSKVIYPPVNLQMKNEKIAMKNKKKDYFLVVSRLSRFTLYKRVDIAIKAATKLGVKLVVIGEGNQKYFKKNAGPTVTFMNSVSDSKLAEYYKNAKALIFPAKEDFGLVMVEAQAMGIPVIAYKKGGALEIIQEGVTGEFFSHQTVDSLLHVLKNFDERQYNSKSARVNAQRFSFLHFEKSLKTYINL